MSRACDALSLDEEKHAILAKAHLALAARCRVASVEETRKDVYRALQYHESYLMDLDESLEFASAELLADKVTMLTVLSATGEALENCGPELREDPDLILAACSESGFKLELASPEMRANRALVLQAVSLDGFALESASPDLQRDREVVLAALESQPLALRYAGDELKQDRDLLLAALKLQTRRHFLIHGKNVLAELLAGPVSDKELLLEASRVDGTIVGHATLELRQDKEFLLEIMRRAPREDQELCYAKADEKLRNALPFLEAQGACNSVLALRGEDAPILSVTLPTGTLSAIDSSHPGPGDASSSSVQCEVSLLSGTTFSFQLRTPAPSIGSSTAAPACDSAGGEPCPLNGSTAPTAATCSSAASGRPPSNGLTARTPAACSSPVSGRPPSNGLNVLTVSQLALQAQSELAAWTEVNLAPARVFMVFVKPDSRGETTSIVATPWDWNLPVSAVFDA